MVAWPAVATVGFAVCALISFGLLTMALKKFGSLAELTRTIASFPSNCAARA